jgi:restriction endonuclease S subunit
MDAEYFQPKYEKLISKIESRDHKRLGDLTSMKKGIEIGAEQYQDEGKLFIRVSSMGKFEINGSDQKYLNEKLYAELKNYFQPQVGEILLTKDATPGIAYVLKENIEGIISGGTLRLKLKEKIEAEYVALCLNSIIGQMQAERDAGGSVIAHWKPEQIKNVAIPILSEEMQQKISDLVRQSHVARKKAKELLESAKRKVEEMIEKG